jgi:hypothetical protein
MPAYCLYTRVLNDLPTSLPSSLTASTYALIKTYIGDASGEIDERVGKKWARQYNSSTQKFPDITDTPATPKLVELCCVYLTLSMCFAKMGEENRADEDAGRVPLKVYYRNLAEKLLIAIADSDQVDLDISTENKFWYQEKYPDDETDYDRVFTNDELDTYSYL